MEKFDVIVVGAGPAGSTAAASLGRQGVRTLLIDRERFPRSKPCGGGISARALARFPYLAAEVMAKISSHPIHKVYLESPAGHSVLYEAAAPVYHLIRRVDFDDALFRRAEPLVTVLEETTIRRLEVERNEARVETSTGQRFTAAVVIGSDSANSLVARHAGLRQGTVHAEYAIDMMEESTYEWLQVRDRDTIYVYYGLARHFGYGYVFPKGEHINLGFGCKLDYYLAHLKGRGREHHREFVDDVRKKGIIQGEPNPQSYEAFPIPISGPLPRTWRDRVLLAGDAGGFVNAFTAEGIYYAMVSGELAARAAVTALHTGDCTNLRHYEDLWRGEIGQDLDKSVSIQKRLLGDPSRIDRVVQAAQKDPRLLALLAGYATGSVAYPELKRYLIRSALPLYLWEKARATIGVN